MFVSRLRGFQFVHLSDVFLVSVSQLVARALGTPWHLEAMPPQLVELLQPSIVGVVVVDLPMLSGVGVAEVVPSLLQGSTSPCGLMERP